MLRSLRPCSALLLAGVAIAQSEAAAPEPVDVAAELSRAIDLPDPDAREDAADDLAKLDVPLEQWLEAMRSFAPGAEARAGKGRDTVPLWNGEKLEDTEIDWLVPRSVPKGQPAPLMLIAHGTGGSGRGAPELWSQAAEATGMIVIAPSESGENDGYGYTDRERRITLGAIRWARRRWDIDENRVFLSGISRGGHLTWDVALRWPDRFAGLVPMIGGPRINVTEAQNNLRYLENIAHVSIRDLQGALDDPGLVFNLRLAFERLKRMDARDAQYLEFPELGHGYDPTAVDWREFFLSTRRDPRPERVVRLVANRDETRSCWVDVLATDSREVEEEFRLRVKEAEWNAMDQEQKRVWLADQADARTARLRARLVAPGEIELEHRHVRRVRFLLTPEMLGEQGRLRVRWEEGERKLRPRPDVRVLLREFVERFDRTFLPTMDADVRL